jgi:hypothetical protein
MNHSRLGSPVRPYRADNPVPKQGVQAGHPGFRSERSGLLDELEGGGDGGADEGGGVGVGYVAEGCLEGLDGSIRLIYSSRIQGA